MLAGVENLDLTPVSQWGPVPPVDENGETFEENAARKALELARYIALADRVGQASRSTAADDDGETDFEAVSARRARAASGRHRRVELGERPGRGGGSLPDDVLVMADDSGLEVDALKGDPGVRSARYAGKHGDDAANNRLLLKNLKGVPAEKRKARFVCVIALATPQRVLFTARGTVEGRIIDVERGGSGFGYDPLFYHEASGKTFGEMSPEGKDSLSHRHHALEQFREKLERRLQDVHRDRGSRCDPGRLT